MRRRRPKSITVWPINTGCVAVSDILGQVAVTAAVSTGEGAEVTAVTAAVAAAVTAAVTTYSDSNAVTAAAAPPAAVTAQ